MNFCVSYEDCLSAVDESKTLIECTFCNWANDLFTVGDGATGGKCCKKGTVPNATHNMCE